MIRTTTDSDQRTQTRAGENATFSALDEERQASMADEGGVSGALMEIDGEEPITNAHLARRILSISWKVALGFALLGFASVLIARTYPRR